MNQAKDGDKVRVHYTGTLEDGTVFDSSKGRDPLEFTIGNGAVMPGLEKGIVGMETGESKTLSIPPEDAFGERLDELVVEVNKSDLPDTIEPAIGKWLKMLQPGGSPIELVITGVSEDTVTLDANHPLAGRTLLFDIQLVEIT
ncbi:MAG: peptidylprolyl isomerase [Desulfobacteraceae bacterium]